MKKTKMWKRILTVLCIAAMMAGIVNPSAIYAGESTQETAAEQTNTAESADTQTETAGTAETAVLGGAGDASGVANTENDADSMSSDSTVTSASENTDNADKEEKSESGEASGTTTDSEGTETTAESYPAVSLNTKTDGGTEISISAPEGAFPSGIQVSVTKVDSEQILSALKEASDNTDLTADQVVAYDFDFYLDNGEHNIEPQKEISVQFSMPQLKKDDSVTAYHLKDENSVAEKEDVTADASAGTATLESGKFSIHALLISEEENSSDGIRINYDSQTDIHFVTDNGNIIILYCLNNLLHWPHATAETPDVPLYTETTIEQFCKENKITDANKIAKINKQLQNLLYAGYPYNGYGLYSIVNSPATLSEEEFDPFLDPPQFLRDDFPNSVGNNTFTYANRTSSEQQTLLTNFLFEAGNLLRGGTTKSGLTYQQLQQLPFWRAAYVMTYFNGDPIDAYSTLYVTNYYVTKSQAYERTSKAIWTLMNQENINSNDIIDQEGLSGKLLGASGDRSILTEEPNEEKVIITGDTRFSYNTNDKKWHSGNLTISSPYGTTFMLDLPDGIIEESGKTSVVSGESFSLISSGKPNESASIKLTSIIPWMDPNLRVYEAMGNVTDANGKGFQNMVGAVVHQKNITKTVDLSSSETSFTFTKIWKDNSNRDNVRPGQDLYKSKIHLMNGTTELTGFTPDITDNGNGTWTITYKDLPQIIDGKDASFTVREDAVYKYSADKATVKNKESITNTYSPVIISGTKTWDDNNNQDGKRPSKITVNLLADGEQIQSQDITADQSGNWTYSFTNLPKYKNGKEIKYTVKESTVDGYKPVINGYNITNIHTPETTEISGTKTWDDNNNQDGKRPTSITVRLLADGKEVSSKTVTADSGWKYKFDKLPVYSNGNMITYTISEDAIEGYSSSIDGFNIINSYTPKQTVLNVQKVWDDSNNQDGKRPNSVTVQLYADETASGEPVTLTASTNWYHTWTELPIYKGGEKIHYTVKETSDLPKGYTPKISGDAEKGYIITNSYTPETTTVSGTKTWSDNNNQDGKRPDKITVRLLADSKEVSSRTVSAADGWTYKFDKLPVYHDGNKIDYSISEDAIPNYTTEISGYNITNSYTPKETSVSVLKNWADSDNQDGKRPNDVQVQLLADGDASGEPVTLTSSNWMYTWKNLPMYKNGGTEIKYTVKEVSKLPDGYSSIITGDAVRGYTITNSYQPEKTTISGMKTWDDNNNQDGKRPDSITVKLLADEIKVDEKTVTASDGWKYSFTDLPVYQNGKKINYAVAEEAVPNYSTSINGYDITNSYTPQKTSLSVLKRWYDNENQDGKRPDSVEVQLYADGVPSGDPVTLKSDGNWMYTWENLPMYENGGTMIAYTVQEISKLPEGYSSSVTGSAKNGYVITNSYTPEKTTVSGSKTWKDNDNQDGMRPDSITVKLLADGIKVDEKTVAASDSWKYSFTDLPVYQNGKKITYAVAEEAVANYSTSINGYDITNSYTPQETSLSVLKRWFDNENQDGKRPNSVQVQLYADGAESREPVTLKAENNWLYTWTGLPMYTSDGTKIQYTVQEVSTLPDGYTSTVTGSAEGGYVISNSYTPETFSIDIAKKWEDGNDKDGIRPDSVKVQLLANGKTVGDAVTLNEENQWKNTWTNLAKYANGKEINYSVEEVEVPSGYSISYSGNVQEGFVVTNKHTPEKTSPTTTPPATPTDTPTTTPPTTPTDTPATTPSTTPTDTPTTTPSTTPTDTPTTTPSSTPTDTPTATPTTIPTGAPTASPSSTPGAPAVPRTPGSNNTNNRNTNQTTGDNSSKVSAGKVSTGRVATGDNTNNRIWQISMMISSALLVLFVIMVVLNRKRDK